MHKLSETTKKNISETTGIPYDKLITMNDDEIIAHIEQKTGKKMQFTKTKTRLKGSGDDSVLIDLGRIRTMEEVDSKINRIINQKRKNKDISTDKEDIALDL